MQAQRRWTLGEYVRLVLLAGDLRAIDPPLGDAVEQVARGNDTQLAVIHDRLHALGRPDLADRVRAVVGVG